MVPDYYATRPKPCMGGWGRGIINVTPSGKVLPCHAAETHPGPRLRQRARPAACATSGSTSDAFQRFRGTDWMREPCRSCEFREVDWGGCRCQAFAFAGDAEHADPACAKSSLSRSVRAGRRAGVGRSAAGFRLPQTARARVELRTLAGRLRPT